MKRSTIFMGLIGIMLTLSGCSSSSSLVLEGIVETSIYANYAEVSGKIKELPVELGQEVKAGDVLAVLDDKNERYALEQLQETLAKKKAILSELKSGVDSEEIKQAQNNVSLAEIAYGNAQLSRDLAKKDYENAQALKENGALAQSELDKVKYQVDLAEAAVTTTSLQLDNARQRLALIQKGTPQEKITAAQADVALTEVQIRQAKENLAKFTITASHDGTIISKNYLLGNLVSPGYNLMDIASATEKHLVAYVPKEYLPKINYGQEVTLRSGEKDYQGTLSFIDVKAQYTPRDLQTTANKNKESMKIHVTFASETPLKVGEKAEVIFFKSSDS